MSPRIKLVIAYLGRPFHGWQRQQNQLTVQGEVERALATFADHPDITVFGAGRTDTGVHARGQVAHTDLPSPIPPSALMRGLNGVLPPEIRIRKAVSVSKDFHARRDAVGKLYVYRGCWRSPRLPWQQLRTAVVPCADRFESMNMVAENLIGRHDWASFTVTEPGVATTTRTLYQLSIHRRRDGLEFHFLGEGFLRYQVRRMVGALLEVGGGRREAEQMLDLVHRPRPGAAIKTAPADGLCLEHVYYRRTSEMAGDRR